MGWSVSQQNAAAEMQHIAAEQRPNMELGFEAQLLPVLLFTLQ
jgi:hypothetical protein